MLKNQDDQLDEIGNIVANLRYENQNFGEEATYQNKLLDGVNKDIDKNQIKLDKSNQKLAKLMKSTNDCCLWCIIITEIVILVLLFTVFK